MKNSYIYAVFSYGDYTKRIGGSIKASSMEEIPGILVERKIVSRDTKKNCFGEMVPVFKRHGTPVSVYIHADPSIV